MHTSLPGEDEKREYARDWIVQLLLQKGSIGAGGKLLISVRNKWGKVSRKAGEQPDGESQPPVKSVSL